MSDNPELLVNPFLFPILGAGGGGGGGGGGIPEAPEDDNYYVRKNAAWENISGESGLISTDLIENSFPTPDNNLTELLNTFGGMVSNAQNTANSANSTAISANNTAIAANAAAVFALSRSGAFPLTGLCGRDYAQVGSLFRKVKFDKKGNLSGPGDWERSLGRGVFNAVVSPDGNVVVFHQQVYISTGSYNVILFCKNLLTGAITQVSDNGGAGMKQQGLAWSKDSTMLFETGNMNQPTKIYRKNDNNTLTHVGSFGNNRNGVVALTHGNNQRPISAFIGVRPAAPNTIQRCDLGYGSWPSSVNTSSLSNIVVPDLGTIEQFSVDNKGMVLFAIDNSGTYKILRLAAMANMTLPEEITGTVMSMCFQPAAEVDILAAVYWNGGADYFVTIVKVNETTGVITHKKTFQLAEYDSGNVITYSPCGSYISVGNYSDGYGTTKGYVYDVDTGERIAGGYAYGVKWIGT